MAFVVAHSDGHGVCSFVLAKRRFGAAGGFCNFRSSSKITKNIRRRRAEILKNPPLVVADIGLVHPSKRFVQELRGVAEKIPVIYIDHHDADYSPLKHRNIAVYRFAGAYEMGKFLAAGDRKSEEVAIIGAICDRDPMALSVVKKRHILAARGLDVLIRRGDRQFGRALKLLETGKFAKLREYSDKVPRIRGICIGAVALTSSKLPGRGWQNKALDELICEHGALYGSGFDYHKHDAVYIFSVHKRWDALGLPSPAELLQTHELGKYITTRDSRRAFIEVPRGKLRNADPKTVNRTIAEAINRALPPDILAAWFENLRLPVRCPACGGGSFEFAKTPTTLKLRTKALRGACLIGEFVCLGCGCAWRGVYSLGRRVQLHVRVIEQEVAG